eukprot:7922514-Pyramimonas_sp.AAC.1
MHRQAVATAISPSTHKLPKAIAIAGCLLNYPLIFPLQAIAFATLHRPANASQRSASLYPSS